MKKIIYIIITIILLCIILIVYNNTKKITNKKILFLGDSITSRYDLNKYYKGYNVVNSGVAGSLSIDILNDMTDRVYKYNPDIIFLLIGTNDIEYSDLTDKQISNNIEKIIDNIKENKKDTIIYLESIYPVNNKVVPSIVGSRENKRIKNINKKLQNVCKKGKCEYINMYDKLTIFNDKIPRIYTQDGLHLNKVGYFYVTRILKKYINEGEK